MVGDGGVQEVGVNGHSWCGGQLVGLVDLGALQGAAERGVLMGAVVEQHVL